MSSLEEDHIGPPDDCKYKPGHIFRDSFVGMDSAPEAILCVHLLFYCAL